MVEDTLSWKAVNMGSLAFLSVKERPLDLDIQLLSNIMVWLDIPDSRVKNYFVESKSCE